jgi:hypothetical protein
VEKYGKSGRQNGTRKRQNVEKTLLVAKYGQWCKIAV